VLHQQAKLRLRTQIYLLLLLISTGPLAFSQEIDSLKQALVKAKHDTSRCQILSAIIEAEGDDAVWPEQNERLKKICETNLEKANSETTLSKQESFVFKKYYSAALNNMGYLADIKGDIPKALEYYEKSLDIKEEINDKSGMAEALNNIGFIYDNQGDISKALKYYGKSLSIQEEIRDKEGMATSLNNIGLIYHSQGNIMKALEYHNKGYKIREEIQDKDGMANSLNNVGFIYHHQGELERALDYYKKSWKTYEEINNRKGMATAINNIGNIYNERHEAKGALEFYGKALKIREEIGDKKGIANSYNNLGGLYLQLGYDKIDQRKNFELALQYTVKGMKISQELGYPENIRYAAKLLVEIYKVTGNYKASLENYEIYIQMRDSINNEVTRKASIRSQLKYDFEKKATADSIRTVEERKVFAARMQQEKTQRFALYGGLALVLVFAGFMVNRFRVTNRQKQIIEIKEKETQKQNEIISHQKNLVEEKQKEVLDSIHYAKRIQNALLPQEKSIGRTLKKLNG
jgi:tetratricopeptide (TPR) repeat protein